MSTAALTTTKTALSHEPSSSNKAASSSVTTTTINSATNPCVAEELNVNASTSSSTLHPSSIPAICRFFQLGCCRYGKMCRFSHDLNGSEVVKNSTTKLSTATHERPSTSRRNWVNAPVFVPKSDQTVAQRVDTEAGRSWAEVVGATDSCIGATSLDVDVLNADESESGSINEVCPYEGVCPYGIYCVYAIHLELCEMCDQFCLHPSDETQRKKHKKECLQQHEQAMELSFAIARSKDKTCGICFDTIMEKAGREKRFGILPNCNHIFCLDCIRKWRQAKQFEHKITRSCPECRVASDFVCPSAFWVEAKEDKDKVLEDYRKALGVKDCKYFKKGDGKCPFGNKCFYKHALPNGDLVDVGGPKKSRKMLRSNNDIINLLDIYLYEFLDHRELNFLDYITSTSDESDDDDDYINDFLGEDDDDYIDDDEYDDDDD